MIYDHGLPVSSRYADSGGRVIVYTFADGKSYMEPVEPPSEQYIDSAAAMLPGAIALRGGKGGLVASRAIAAEAIEDAIANRAGQAASAASGGYLSWVPAPILAILFGARPKPKPDVLDDAAEAAKNAGTSAAKGVDDVAGATGENAASTVSSSPAAKVLTGVGDETGVEVAKGGAKPTPKFQLPTNPPQVPPAVDSLPPDVRLFVGKPTQQYAHGYWKIEKFDGRGWQRLDPRTMKPGTHPDSHVPLPENYPGPFTN